MFTFVNLYNTRKLDHFTSIDIMLTIIFDCLAFCFYWIEIEWTLGVSPSNITTSSSRQQPQPQQQHHQQQQHQQRQKQKETTTNKKRNADWEIKIQHTILAHQHMFANTFVRKVCVSGLKAHFKKVPGHKFSSLNNKVWLKLRHHQIVSSSKLDSRQFMLLCNNFFMCLLGCTHKVLFVVLNSSDGKRI